jgi:hypothetical protein
MGTRTVIITTDKVEFITCPAPTDVVCQTCPAPDDGTKKFNVGRFIHEPSNPNIGKGYTDVNIDYLVTPSGMEYHIEFNPSSQIITNYQQWLNYFNLSNPLLPHLWYMDYSKINSYH